MNMERNCNLELQLLPPSSSFPSSHLEFSGHRNHHHHHRMKETNGSPQHQELTIFYNGRVSVCDVTEIQARSIILLAMEETRKNTPTESQLSSNSAPLIQHCHTDNPTGMSMKRSLQRFLQKRKTRIQSTSPYNNLH